MTGILGIIAEYNPLHTGHARHLERALLESHCQYGIIALSGNFVQRGAPALADKWSRARMAVAAGADLVLEIPVWFVLRSAEGYARAGVSILAACGASSLSFGSESGSLADLGRLASWLEKPGAQAAIRRGLARGIPYAAAIQQAAGACRPSFASLLQGPNNVLGLEYLRALAKTAITPHTLKREEGGIRAGQVRRLLGLGREDEAFAHIPPDAAPILRAALAGAGLRGAEDFTQGIFYALTRLGAPGIKALPACSEGLENRVCRALAQSSSLAELLAAIKSKRYPLVRLQRLVFQALLGFESYSYTGPVPYLRVLAVAPRGKELLPRLARSGVPLLYSARDIPRLDPAAKKLLDLDLLAEKVYRLGQGGKP